MVQFTALPYDASILVNGEIKGQRTVEIEVTEGQTTTVEVTKRGFANVRRVVRLAERRRHAHPRRTASNSSIAR